MMKTIAVESGYNESIVLAAEKGMYAVDKLCWCLDKIANKNYFSGYRFLDRELSELRQKFGGFDEGFEINGNQTGLVTV